MRHFILLFISCALLFSCSHADFARYRSYPGIAAVSDKFDHNYKFFSSKTFYFTFAKKPKGWYVVKVDNKTIKPIAEELFWSANNGKYEEVPRNFFSSTDVNEWMFDMKSQIRGQEYSYDHSIYFGYEGWEDDVISELGSANNLNDTLLECLARAYGSKCSNLSRNGKDNSTVRSAEMTDGEAQDFCDYGKKDLETYQKLLELNPEYETMVGKVKTKLSNEYMFLWSELKQAGKEKEAEQFLIDGLYDDLMINFAKNMLVGADKNAIVFTNGDNDTYPLWYVQYKLGFRKDVAVMNISIMNISDWLLSDKKNYAFDMKLSENFYHDAGSDLLYLSGDQKNVFGMGTLAEGLEKKDPSFSGKMEDGSGYQLCPFKHIRLSYIEDDSLAPVTNIKAGYLVKSEIAMLDIISSNLGKRPIYFAQTAAFGTVPEAIALSLRYEGMLAKIVQGENQGKLFQDKYYDLDLCLKNTSSVYNYGLENVKNLQVEEIAVNYILNFNNLIGAMLEKGDTTQAMQTAMFCVNKLNFPLYKDPVGAYLIGEELCIGGKTEEGRKLLNMSVDKTRKAYPDEKEASDLDRLNSILDRIVADAQKYDFKELINPCTELKDSIAKKLAKIPRESNELQYP